MGRAVGAVAELLGHGHGVVHTGDIGLARRARTCIVVLVAQKTPSQHVGELGEAVDAVHGFENHDACLENNDGFLENNDVSLENNDGFLEINNGYLENNAGFLENNAGFLENNVGCLENNDVSLENNAGFLENNDVSLASNVDCFENNVGCLVCARKCSEAFAFDPVHLHAAKLSRARLFQNTVTRLTVNFHTPRAEAPVSALRRVPLAVSFPPVTMNSAPVENGRDDDAFEAVHVTDAEGDFFELFARLNEQGTSFVIRAGQLDRWIKLDTREVRLREAVDSITAQAIRHVVLGERGQRKTAESHREATPGAS